MSLAALATFAVGLLSASAQTTDPLFRAMEGHWTGRGARTQLRSGHRFTIETVVESRMEGNRLVSRNEVREVAPDGSTRHYSKSYWLENRDDGSGGYLLGADGARPAEGRFSQDTFELRQDLGGSSGLRIESVTRFEENASLYRERLLSGGQVLSETEIEYSRETH